MGAEDLLTLRNSVISGRVNAVYLLPLLPKQGGTLRKEI